MKVKFSLDRSNISSDMKVLVVYLVTFSLLSDNVSRNWLSVSLSTSQSLILAAAAAAATVVHVQLAAVITLVKAVFFGFSSCRRQTGHLN